MTNEKDNPFGNLRKVGSEGDLTGKIFGRLEVVKFGHKHKTSGMNFWRCKCVCGDHVVFNELKLLSGSATSCGCAHNNHIPPSQKLSKVNASDKVRLRLVTDKITLEAKRKVLDLRQRHAEGESIESILSSLSKKPE